MTDTSVNPPGASGQPPPPVPPSGGSGTAGAQPPVAPPPPSAPRPYEIWVLTKKDGTAAIDKPYKFRRAFEWERKDSSGDTIATLTFDAGRNFRFQPKKRKPSKKTFKEGDIVVVDKSSEFGDDSASLVPKAMLGRNGAIYMRTDVKGTAAWTPIYPVPPAPKKKPKGKRKSGKPAKSVIPVPKVDAYLDAISGEAGHIIAARPVLDPESMDDFKDADKAAAKALFSNYAYFRIRGTSSIDVDDELSASWLLVQPRLAPDLKEGKWDPARLAELLESGPFAEYDDAIADLAEKYDDILEEFSHLAMLYDVFNADEDDTDKLIGLLDAFVGETVPSLIPGTTQPMATFGSILSIADSLGQAGDTDAAAFAKIFDAAALGATQSGFEGAASVVALIKDIVELRQLFAKRGKQVQDVRIRSKLLDVTDHIAKAGASGYAIADIVTQAAHKAAETTPPAGLDGTAVPFVGVAISAANVGRTGAKAARTVRKRVRLANLRAMMTQDQALKKDGACGDDHQLYLCLDYIESKMKNRTGRQVTTVVAGTLSVTAGSIAGAMAIIGAVGIANAWNPVGWAIGGLAVGVGIGLLMRTIIRHNTKSKRRKHRIAKKKPHSVDTFARRVLAIALDEPDPKSTKGVGMRGTTVLQRNYAYRILRIFIVKIRTSRTEPRFFELYDKYADKPEWNRSERARKNAISRIRRHVKQ